MANIIPVFVVAQPLIRWGLQRMIETAPGLEYAGGATWGPHVTNTPELKRARVALLLLNRVTEAEVAGFCGSVAARPLLLTDLGSCEAIDQALLSGARGVVRTSETPHTLLTAIEKVDLGELWIDRGETTRLFTKMARGQRTADADPERSKISLLTVRERQTVSALVGDAAAPGKVIADRLSISEHTLRNHLTSIYGKLGVRNRVDLYAFATRHALHCALP